MKVLWHSGSLWLGRVTIVFLGVFLSLSVVYMLEFSEKIMPNVYIESISVGGLSREAARKKIVTEITKRGNVLLVEANGDKRRIQQSELNIKYRVDAVVDEAWSMGRENSFGANIKDKFLSFSTKKRIEMKIDYSPEEILMWSSMVASEQKSEAKKPSLMLKNGVVLFENGVDGVRVDKDKLVKLTLSTYRSLNRKELVVPVEIDKNKLSPEMVNKVLSLAKRVSSRKIQIKREGYSRELDPKKILDLINFKASWNREKIKRLVDEIADEIDRPAVNAKFEMAKTGLVHFVNDEPGVVVDKNKLEKLILSSLNSDLDVIEIPVGIKQAELRAGDVNNLGINERLGRGYSEYKGSIAGRVYNIALASSRINGVLIKPGEIFSFNKVVGDISAATGYKRSYVIKNGRTVLGDGGGVCQVSTTLFRAVLDAGLPIVERKAHSYRVGYYEQNYDVGFDATVFSPSVDFRFKNNTGKYLLIQTRSDSKNMNLSIDIYGTSDGRVSSVSKAKIFSQTPPPEPLYIDDPTLMTGKIKQIDWSAWGTKTAFEYKVMRNNEVLFEKTFYSNFRPWQAVYLRGTKIN